MKKLLLIGALALLGANVNAQESHFKLGAHAGLPIGDAGDAYSFNAGLDVAYTWEIADNFELGATTGYSHYFGKEYSTPAITMGPITIPAQSYKFNVGAIPVAATAQYSFDGGFNLGADLGYAFLTGDADGGGFYYQPKVGYTFAEKHNVYAGYKGISKDGTLSSVNIGYAYKF
ncbi:outer membrane scaffolding protein for murein synthesis (MipA/OmpV family) [Chryseobacterium defluvii]|uniref:Outer membrane scaffolding protein for murein synthesis (MipA/OmpV family) n=1 Tax=Chryseobacterium defluvii TaxID=160396 RepID=A0A840K800_9FLAO|nr:outer membrane beta-barrel protein [Chryseobacterium defluvii]MBB4805631.1 outer membrane scaffolding protein for murein synthesis (MipA/OmpV family) [Chryseobacterium defluvii]